MRLAACAVLPENGKSQGAERELARHASLATTPGNCFAPMPSVVSWLRPYRVSFVPILSRNQGLYKIDYKYDMKGSTKGLSRRQKLALRGIHITHAREMRVRTSDQWAQKNDCSVVLCAMVCHCDCRPQSVSEGTEEEEPGFQGPRLDGHHDRCRQISCCDKGIPGLQTRVLREEPGQAIRTGTQKHNSQ